MRTSVLIASIAALPLAAMARAPQPAKPVPIGLYSGRWYEIARTPNPRERGCKGVASDFSGMAGGAFAVIETCQRASGRPKVSRTKATLVPASGNAKFRMSLLGGLIHPEFWIVATASGGDWAIMGTPGGHYVWILSRKAALPVGERAEVMAKAAALGYPTGRLEYD